MCVACLLLSIARPKFVYPFLYFLRSVPVCLLSFVVDNFVGHVRRFPSVSSSVPVPVTAAARCCSHDDNTNIACAVFVPVTIV